MMTRWHAGIMRQITCLRLRFTLDVTGLPKQLPRYSLLYMEFGSWFSIVFIKTYEAYTSF